MSTKPELHTIPGRTQRLLRSMQDTLYWFQDRLAGLQLALASDPQAIQAYAELSNFPFDLLAELKDIRERIETMDRAFLKARGELYRLTRHDAPARLRSIDLPQAEQDQLHQINHQLEQITQHIGGAATQIGGELDRRLADPSDRLWDYEMEAKVSLVLRETDPAYSEDSDNFLAQLDLFLFERKRPGSGWEISGSEWPDGYAFEPMAHGRMFHELLHHSDGSNGRLPVNLTDILRIGGVWCDLTVIHQFYFDLTRGQWIKLFKPTDAGAAEPVYVQAHPGTP